MTLEEVKEQLKLMQAKHAEVASKLEATERELAAARQEHEKLLGEVEEIFVVLTSGAPGGSGV